MLVNTYETEQVKEAFLRQGSLPKCSLHLGPSGPFYSIPLMHASYPYPDTLGFDRALLRFKAFGWQRKVFCTINQNTAEV